MANSYETTITEEEMIETKFSQFPSTEIIRYAIPLIAILAIISTIVFFLRFRSVNHSVLFIDSKNNLVFQRKLNNDDGLEIQTKGAEINSPPIWSPDGRLVAVGVKRVETQEENKDDGTQSITEETKENLLVYDLQNELVLLEREGVNGEVIPLFGGWSYDNEYLLFLEPDNGIALLNIYEISTGKVVETPHSVDFTHGFTWHPTKNSLLFTYRTEENIPDLKILRADGSEENLNLDDNKAAHAGGAWSPDGNKLIYIAWDYNESGQAIDKGLWMTTSDSSKPQQIYKGDANSPFWTPNGEFILFANDDGELIRLNSVSSDTSNASLTLNNFGFIYQTREAQKDWSPDGKLLLVMNSSNQAVVYDSTVNEIVGSEVAPNTSGLEWHPSGHGYAINTLNGNSKVVWLNQMPPEDFIFPKEARWITFGHK